MCVAAFVWIPDTSSAMYDGGFALFAIAVAALVAAAVAPGPSPLRSILSVAPLRWIGAISYGLYLWHWPVQVALDEPRTGISGFPLDALRITATFALATLSYYLVERPIRRGALGRRAYVVTPAAFAGAAAAVLLVAATAVPPPAYLRNDSSAASIRSALRKLPAATGTGIPTPTTAVPAQTSVTNPANPPVTFAPHRVLLVGDSVMDSLSAALRSTAAATGVSLASATLSGCGTVIGEPTGDDGTAYPWAADCARKIPGLQTAAVTRNRPDVIAWLSSWEAADRILGGELVRVETPSGFQTIYDLIDQAVQRLTATGARVAFLTLPPATNGDDVAPPTDNTLNRDRLMDEMLTWYAYRHPATTYVVDFSDKVCPGGPPCPEVVDGVRLRPNDGNHYSPTGAAAVAPWILAQVTTPRLMASHN